MKALHELGHATATKAGGGEVHDMGIIVLVLLPVPYVEASAATVFKSKYRRAMVGAAGVIIELFIAALAFYAWMLVEPGIARAVLFDAMVIASISTLVFNGNPLLRYDAYYILADLIEVPNLAARSARYWGYLLQRYVLGGRDAETPAGGRGEKAWFVFYGLAATCYRVLVTVVIAMFIAHRFYVIGVLLALWAVGAMALLPLVRGINHLTASPGLRRHRLRGIAAAVGIALAVGTFLLGVPLPYHSHAEGVLWLPEAAIVRAGADGFLQKFIVEPGNRVTKGETLLRFSDPALNAELRGQEAKVAEFRAEYDAAFVADPAKAQIARDKLDSAEASLAAAGERTDELLVQARTEGVFVVPEMADIQGRYFRKGDLVGYVMGKASPLARVVVPQDAVDQVRLAPNGVEVRLADDLRKVLQGHIVREVPAGDEQLPSPALAMQAGGDIATDPRDPKDPKALQRVFQFDVALSSIGQLDHFGQRVFVRFDYRMAPLALQWYRGLRLLFLTSFNV